jgi:hypothetical protein
MDEFATRCLDRLIAGHGERHVHWRAKFLDAERGGLPDGANLLFCEQG